MPCFLPKDHRSSFICTDSTYIRDRQCCVGIPCYVAIRCEEKWGCLQLMARNGAYIFCRDRKKGGQPDFICKYQHRDKIPMVRPAPGSRTLPVAELRYLVVLGGEHGAAPERGTTVSLVHTLNVRLLVRLALESLLEREPTKQCLLHLQTP